MANYLLTSSQFTGSVTIRYDATGLFESVEINATLTPEQRAWLLQRTPPNEADLQRVLGNSKTAKLAKLPAADITFEMFWDKYNDKVSSSRKRTEARWRQMSKSDQQKAYMFIPRYFNNIPSGLRKKYAEKYLNDELWNN